LPIARAVVTSRSLGLKRTNQRVLLPKKTLGQGCCCTRSRAFVFAKPALERRLNKE
jgi:hypothetical protein